MELNDIKLKVRIKPSWRKGYKEIYIYLPIDDIMSIKQKIVSVFDELYNDVGDYQFILEGANYGVSFKQEDDLYMMLANIPNGDERIVRMTVNKLEKRDFKSKMEVDKVHTVESKNDIEEDREAKKRIQGAYKGSEEVICVFCKTTSHKRGVIKDLGRFYGPFNYNTNQTYYVHELCALWTPNVYLDEKTHKLMNIEKEIKRCSRMKCSHCGGFGAGVGCLYEKCRKTYHFKCLLEEDLKCHLNEDEYTILCPQHADQEKMEVEDLCCEVCGKDTYDDKLLICEKCTKGFHTFCLIPALKNVPKDEWFCGICAGTEERLLWDNQ